MARWVLNETNANGPWWLFQGAVSTWLIRWMTPLLAAMSVKMMLDVPLISRPAVAFPVRVTFLPVKSVCTWLPGDAVAATERGSFRSYRADLAAATEFSGVSAGAVGDGVVLPVGAGLADSSVLY